MAKTERKITVELTVTRDEMPKDDKMFRSDIVGRLKTVLIVDDIAIIAARDRAIPKLTKRERYFCELVETGYIARDQAGSIWWYENKPAKREGFPGWVDQESDFWQLDSKLPGVCFNFIRWEDSEPWAVEDLLKLEVEL